MKYVLNTTPRASFLGYKNSKKNVYQSLHRLGLMELKAVVFDIIYGTREDEIL